MDRPTLESFIKSPIQSEDIVRIKHGKDGKQGLRGPKGEKGDRGINGRNGVDGLNGENGKDGERGERGLRGPKGEKGEDGKEGRAGKDAVSLGEIELDGAEVVKAIHSSKKKIKPSAIEGWNELEGLAKSANANVKRYVQLGGPSLLGVGAAANAIGRAATLIFGSGLTVTPLGDGTTVQITASGSASGINPQVPSGTINSSNTTFTAVGIVSVAVVDGVIDSGAVISGTPNSTIVYSVPPQNSVYAF